MASTWWRKPFLGRVRSARSGGKRGRSRLAHSPLVFERLEDRVVPFKPYTHIQSGTDILRDVLSDGRITVAGREYAVDSRVVNALRQYPAYYNAGAVGPDGFPDLVMGQSIIHPENTGRWLTHVLNSAWQAQSDASYTATEKGQILAFSYGFLTHAAGDLWAHSLVNEFAEGIFPAVGEILTDREMAEIALRHIIVEGYIGDATPGFDGNPERSTLPDGDVSDDSTPSVAFNAPTRFIYNTLVRNGVGPSNQRGVAIDYFRNLRARLVAQINGQSPSLREALEAFDRISNAVQRVRENCLVFPPRPLECLRALRDLGRDTIGSIDEILRFLSDVVTNATNVVRNGYLRAWVEDIDRGLTQWGDLGLAVTKGLFDPQARRVLQNRECRFQGAENSLTRANCEAAIDMVDTVLDQSDPFINRSMLSMIGFPDLAGSLRAILQQFAAQFNTLFGILRLPFNPLREGLARAQEFAKDLIKDQLSQRFGLPIELIEQYLHHASARMDIQTINVPRYGTLRLFRPEDHEKLDRYLGLTGAHHVNGTTGRLRDDVLFNPTTFAAYANTVTTGKLLLLLGPQMDQVLSDLLGAPYRLYAPNGNILTTTLPGAGRDPTEWLRLIDGDHGWRQDGLPTFPPGGPHGAEHGGNGNFPLWESCLLRDRAFRVLFRDWENGVQNFPDLGDATSRDPNEQVPTVTYVAATRTLTVTGTTGVDRITVRRVAGTPARLRVSWEAGLSCAGGNNFVERPLTDVSRLVLLGQAGDDSFDVEGTVPLELDGGPGADTVALTQGTVVSTQTQFRDLETLHLQGGTLDVASAVSFANLRLQSGTLTGTGTLTVTASATWTGGAMTGTGRTVIAAGATLTVSEAAPKTLQARTLENAGAATWLGAGDITGGTGTIRNLASGTFAAAGALNGTLLNEGRLHPGGPSAAGSLRVTGRYTQTTTGTLHLQIAGRAGTQYDQLIVSGQAQLAGTLSVTVLAGFTPLAGDSFRVLTFGTRSGDFENRTGLALGALRFDPRFAAGELNLVVVNVLRFVVRPAGNSVTAGTPLAATVTVVDANNQRFPGYRGTVRFGSTDTLASLPGAYTFTAGDGGEHVFPGGITLRTAGQMSITVTDSADGSMLGRGDVTVNAAAAVGYYLEAPVSARAGTPVALSLYVVDAFFNLATSYTGTVRFTSTDPQASLPPAYTFTPGDFGFHAFSATLRTADAQTLTVVDTANANLLAQMGLAIQPGPAALYFFDAPETRAGTPVAFTLVVVDAFFNLATDYRGSIRFASADAQATLPGEYRFTEADSGFHTFTVTLRTAGNQGLRATDTVTGSLTGSTELVVRPGPISGFYVDAPAFVLPGATFTITVYAVDAFFNLASDYTGTVRFTSSDPGAMLPPSYRFTAADIGVRQFTGVRLSTPGWQLIAVFDTVDARLTGAGWVEVGAGGAPGAPGGGSSGKPEGRQALPGDAVQVPTEAREPARPPVAWQWESMRRLERHASRDLLFTTLDDTEWLP